MCAKSQGQKIHTKKDIQNLPTYIVVKKISLLPTLTPSQGLKNWLFTTKFFSQDNLYVENMCFKFKDQKIHPKKDIQILLECVVVRKVKLSALLLKF